MINNENNEKYMYIARGNERYMEDKIIKFSFHAHLLLVNNESRNYEYFLIYVTRITYYIT